MTLPNFQLLKNKKDIMLIDEQVEFNYLNLSDYTTNVDTNTFIELCNDKVRLDFLGFICLEKNSNLYKILTRYLEQEENIDRDSENPRIVTDFMINKYNELISKDKL